MANSRDTAAASALALRDHRDLTSGGKNWKPGLTPTRHLPLGLLHAGFRVSVRPVRPRMVFGPSPPASRTVVVMQSPLMAHTRTQGQQNSHPLHACTSHTRMHTPAAGGVIAANADTVPVAATASNSSQGVRKGAVCLCPPLPPVLPAAGLHNVHHLRLAVRGDLQAGRPGVCHMSGKAPQPSPYQLTTAAFRDPCV